MQAAAAAAERPGRCCRRWLGLPGPGLAERPPEGGRSGGGGQSQAGRRCLRVSQQQQQEAAGICRVCPVISPRGTMVEKQRCPLQRDGVYRWFSELTSSQRIEFLCGLLDLCIPLELRFLGSCLEDLARKDYHSLRDSEIKANNPADLASLTNLTDEVVRSKLLLSLALLASDNREAAGVLCRTLTHIDSIINNLGLQLNDGRTGDEFLLLFTMATIHPAFSFHQKQLLRKELSHIQGRHPSSSSHSQGCCPSKLTPRTENPISSVGNSLANALHISAHSIEDSLPKRPSGKHSKVNVEKIEIKVLTHKKEKNADCCFEVIWSDSSVSLITKSSAEVTELISKLSHLFSDDFEKCIPYRGGVDSYSMDRNHVDLDLDLRCLASLPPQVLKSDLIKKFFSNSTNHQQHQNLSLGNPCHVKVNTPVGPSIRPICGVAGIQSSHNNMVLHHSGATMTMSPCSSSSSITYRPQVEANSSAVISSSVPSPQTQEQQDILEWLRKLRLHKYYAVFSQLSMKKFLSLTEEDLNKFESLTMGAKKKLKTQLELEKEKSEKRCLNPTPCTFTSGGVARVPPTSHVGPVQNVHCNHATELCVAVEPRSSQMPQEGSSMSEYSSSPSSPMGIQMREESSDSAEEMDRRLGRHMDCSERDKSVLLVNHFTSSSVRPTAQVLPVQNDSGSGPSGHHPLPFHILAGGPSHMSPIHMVNTLHKLDRTSGEIKLLQSSTHAHLSSEERSKASSGPRGGIKIEKSFGNVLLDVKASSSSLQSGPVISIMPDSGSMQQTVSFGVRAKVGNSVTGERTIKQPALMVENSTPATMASTPVFPVTPTPVKLIVSSSDSSVVGQLACTSVSPAIINPRNVHYTANTKVAFSAMSGMPVTQLPGNFCTNSNASSSNHASTSYTNVANGASCPVPSSSPTISPTSDGSFYSCGGNTPTVNIQISNQTPSHHHIHHHHQQQQTGCTVCSSCGCSGSCGSGGVAVNYGNYFQHQFSAPSMFPFSLMPFSAMCNNGYINTQQYNNSATFPVVHTPYNSSLNPDAMLSGQPSFSLPPMQNFMTGTAGVYQPQGIMGTINGTAHKKSGNISCYNCGVSGHRAQDCKQPSMDFNQQGTFRLKYAPPPDCLDSAD
ncbi:zinc finger CCHC domain-containing protein 14 isoform X2 [Pseudophryne corroboree]|uniref:zinc finger CCHC domain-containing protein 14 isoform X2 n=1 Tax=Pseudophryne corroboree TaxID=495146 RepID=UPI00308155CE